MTAQQGVRVARPRGEVDRQLVDDILSQKRMVEHAQQRLEKLVAEALANGASLNELARQTAIAKTMLLRWSRR